MLYGSDWHQVLSTLVRFCRIPMKVSATGARFICVSVFSHGWDATNSFKKILTFLRIPLQAGKSSSWKLQVFGFSVKLGDLDWLHLSLRWCEIPISSKSSEWAFFHEKTDVFLRVIVVLQESVWRFDWACASVVMSSLPERISSLNGAYS